VVSTNPIPNMNGKIIQMFQSQTTSQGQSKKPFVFWCCGDLTAPELAGSRFFGGP
jgi:hypothetical protein